MASLLNSFSAFCKIPFIYHRVKCCLTWHIRMKPLVTSVFQVLIAVFLTTHRYISNNSDHHRQHHMNYKYHLLQCFKINYWTVSWANWALSIISPSALSAKYCSYLLLHLPCECYIHVPLFLCLLLVPITHTPTNSLEIIPPTEPP